MKLHLGCGKRFIPGFVHIDIVDFKHIDHVCAIDKLDAIESNSCELVYSCHVLEHFPHTRVVEVLTEWRRVLIPGGICRVAVPDFEALCRIYNLRANLNEIMGPVFGKQDYLYNIHRSVFDYRTLGKAFFDAGFSSVRPWDWRTTEHAHIDDYSQAYIPHMDKKNGTLISLNLEGVK